MVRNSPVIETLLNELQREAEKITRAQARIELIKEELAELGMFFPDTDTNHVHGEAERSA